MQTLLCKYVQTYLQIRCNMQRRYTSHPQLLTDSCISATTGCQVRQSDGKFKISKILHRVYRQTLNGSGYFKTCLTKPHAGQNYGRRRWYWSILNFRLLEASKEHQTDNCSYFIFTYLLMTRIRLKDVSTQTLHLTQYIFPSVTT